jgi:chaperonin GroEL
VAVIKVGAATETEMKEKKHASRTRCTRPRRPKRDRPRRRCRADSGVESADGLKLGGDQQIGVNIVKRAIEEPMR